MRATITLLLLLQTLFCYDLDPLFLEEGCIDVRTGEWILQKEEGTYRSLEGKWHLFPHTHLTLFGPNYDRVQICEKSGTPISYLQGDEGAFEIVIPPSVTNTSRGVVGAKTYLGNQTLVRKDKFTFVVKTPDETLRTYKKAQYLEGNFLFLLKNERFADGTTLEYGYDSEHRLYTVCGKRVAWDFEAPVEEGVIYSYKGKTFVYDEKATVVTTPDGFQTRYRFTKEKQLKSITHLDRNGQTLTKTTYHYSESGLLLKKNDRIYGYDARGNPILEIEGSDRIERSYDGRDRLIGLYEEKEGNSLWTTYHYNDEDQLDQICLDNGSSKRTIDIEGGVEFPTKVWESIGDTLLRQTITHYGADEIVEEIYDPDGTLCIRREIPSSGIHKPWLELHIGGTFEEDGYEVQRDHFGRRVAKRVLDEKGQCLWQKTWQYNAFHLLSKTSPMGVKTSYSYNEKGQNISKTLHTANGPIETQYTYDGRGRVATSTCGELLTQYLYDKKDQLVETREETLNGKLLTLNAPKQKPLPSIALNLPQNLEGVEIEKDRLGNITNVRTLDGTIHYTIRYNLASQPVEISDHITGAKGKRVYDDLGNLIEETLLNGLTLRSQRDLYGRRTCLTLPDQSKIFSRWGPKFLEQIHRISHRGKFEYIHQFVEYNLLGFPIRQRQMGDFGEIRFDVDKQLNITGIHSQFVEQTGPTDKKQATLEPIPPLESWKTDGLGRVIEIRKPGRTITFTYDVWNRRMTKVIQEEVPDRRYDPVDLAYLYDDAREIGTMSRYSGKLIELRTLAETPANSGDQAVAYELENLLYLPQHDLEGNVTSLISVVRGKLIESYQYLPSGKEQIFDIYGETLEVSKALNPWRFSCYRKDPETHLYLIDGIYCTPEKATK